MKRVLIFDTETTGFIDRKKPLGDSDQPRILQLAYILATEDGRVIEERNMLFSPLLSPNEEYEIPADATEVNGIDTEFAVDNGWKQNYAPTIFKNICNKADLLVAHNAKYDFEILKVAYSRFLSEDDIDELSNKPLFCTMQKSTNLIKIPPTQRMIDYGRRGYKNPSLSEAHKHFFDEEIVGAHDAMVDTKACARVFFHIDKMEKDLEHNKNSGPEF